MRKKISAIERLAQRPGPQRKASSKAIREPHQRLNPQIDELNDENRKNRRGAPKGNKNHWIHGCYGSERKLWMLEVRILSRQTRWLHEYVRSLSRAARAERLRTE